LYVERFHPIDRQVCLVDNVQRSTLNFQLSTSSQQDDQIGRKVEPSAEAQKMNQEELIQKQRHGNLSAIKAENRMSAKEYDLEERLLDYAVQIIRVVESLPQTRAGNHVAAQLLRSGTSALPNHAEAQAAESRRLS